KGWRAICQTIFNELLVPFTEREHTRLDASQRIVLLKLLHLSRKSRAHGDFRTLTNVTEQATLNCDVSDLFIVEGFAHKAQHKSGRFGEGHLILSLEEDWPPDLGVLHHRGRPLTL